MKKRISILLVILWMILIFVMSSFGSVQSNNQSDFVVGIFSNLFDFHNLSRLSYVIRKIAHLLEYLILGILVANMIKNKDGRYPKFFLVYQKMKAEVDERAKEASIATAVEVLQFYTSVLRNEVKEEVPMVVSTGDFCSEVQMVEKGASLRDRKGAADSLAKHYGILTDKVALEVAPIVIKDDVLDDS